MIDNFDRFHQLIRIYGHKFIIQGVNIAYYL